MSGTKSGAIKIVAINKAKYGEDYYVRLGALGGKKRGVQKGFALDRERARAAGRIGGTISRRPKNKSATQ